MPRKKFQSGVPDRPFRNRNTRPDVLDLTVSVMDEHAARATAESIRQWIYERTGHDMTLNAVRQNIHRLLQQGRLVRTVPGVYVLSGKEQESRFGDAPTREIPIKPWIEALAALYPDRKFSPAELVHEYDKATRSRPAPEIILNAAQELVADGALACSAGVYHRNPAAPWALPVAAVVDPFS